MKFKSIKMLQKFHVYYKHITKTFSDIDGMHKHILLIKTNALYMFFFSNSVVIKPLVS